MFPESGRNIPEFQRPDLREVILGSYRIVDRLHADRAVMLTVFHGARLFPKMVEGAIQLPHEAAKAQPRVKDSMASPRKVETT